MVQSLNSNLGRAGVQHARGRHLEDVRDRLRDSQSDIQSIDENVSRIRGRIDIENDLNGNEGVSLDQSLASHVNLAGRSGAIRHDDLIEDENDQELQMAIIASQIQ